MLADFAFSDGVSLSRLHNVYCVSAFGGQMCKHYDDKCTHSYYVAWRKVVRRIWKLENRTHNNLLHIVTNVCLLMSNLRKDVSNEYIYNHLIVYMYIHYIKLLCNIR